MSTKNPQLVAQLEQKLQANRRVTMTEAAALTGLSIDQSEIGMREMVNRYDCQLQVTQNGDIIYDFGQSLNRRHAKSFQEHLADFAAFLWLIFTYVFKAGIAFTLIVYCLLFAVILIGLAIAKVSDDDDDFFSGLITLMADIFISIFRWHTATEVVLYAVDDYGYRYQQYAPKKEKIKKEGKGIIASVYDFVFGPPRVNIDPLNNIKEAAAFIRNNKGILVPADLKALAGLNAKDAANLFSECIARFNGDIKVSDNGIMYGEFDQLTRTVNTADKTNIIYYWDEYEPDYQLTGNTNGSNALIMGLNSFNLIASAVATGILSAQSTGLAVLLGWIPLTFSLLFFIIPLVRYMVLIKARSDRHWQNMRKRVMRVIFNKQGAPFSINELYQLLNNPATQEEALTKEVLEQLLNELKNDLPGDILYDDQGNLLYTFPIISMEMKEAKRLRAKRQSQQDLGKVVFDSEK